MVDSLEGDIVSFFCEHKIALSERSSINSANQIRRAFNRGHQQFRAWDETAELEKARTFATALANAFESYESFHPMLRQQIENEYANILDNRTIGPLENGNTIVSDENEPITIDLEPELETVRALRAREFTGVKNRHVRDTLLHLMLHVAGVGPDGRELTASVQTAMKHARSTSSRTLTNRAQASWKKIAVVDATRLVWREITGQDAIASERAEGDPFQDFLETVFRSLNVQAEPIPAIREWRKHVLNKFDT